MLLLYIIKNLNNVWKQKTLVHLRLNSNWNEGQTLGGIGRLKLRANRKICGVENPACKKIVRNR
jgi:hypothetical protein